MDSSGARQAAHYDRILSDYDQHYYDRYSLEYRERFILDPLLRGLDLRGKRVADLACGSGQTSLSLMSRFPGVKTTGFDVSPEACRRYREAVGQDCHVVDLTAHDAPVDGGFDAAVIMGGLHHCVSNLPGALATIAGMLAPGGYLLMFEPSSRFGLEFARRVWYRLDTYFEADTEAALSHDDLVTKAPPGVFEIRDVAYFGGPAFFLVYNSLVFRMPHGVKNAVSPALLALESAYGKLPGKFWFSSFTAQWRKRG